MRRHQERIIGTVNTNLLAISSHGERLGKRGFDAVIAFAFIYKNISPGYSENVAGYGKRRNRELTTHPQVVF